MPKRAYTDVPTSSPRYVSSNAGNAVPASAPLSTTEASDGKLLELTGQMPMRLNLPTVYASYFANHPDYVQFADQAGRVVEVPNVENSTEIWQTFRNAWTSAVVFDDEPIDKAFADAAARANELLAEGSTS